MTRMRIRFTPIVVLTLLTLLVAEAPVLAQENPFEGEIQAFEQADKKQPPPKNAVEFVGSSSIRFWGTLAQDFPHIPVINRGFGGSQLDDSTRYADRIIIPYHPRQIVLYAGDNDLAAGKTAEQVSQEFQDFVKKVRGALPEVRISFISIKPSLARWKLVEQIKQANHLIEQYAKKEKNIDYIDVFTPMLGPDGKPRAELLRPDGLHMTPKGYELWTSIIAPKLEG